MGWTTPPTVDPGLKANLDSFVTVAKNNAAAIAEKLLYKAVSNSGVTPKVSLPPLIQLINTMLIPTVHRWEGGWANHPSDPGGATMRGVTIATFKSSFNGIFINTGIPQVKTAAEALNSKYPNWRDDNAKAKAFLYTICSDETVGGLWFMKFLADDDCRYPIAVMTEDPYLGYFFAATTWWSGAGAYSKSGFDDVARSMGWNGNDSTWAKFIAGLGTKTPEFASKVLMKRCARLQAITGANGSPGPEFRNGFMNRFMNDPKESDVMMLVRINEAFNFNVQGTFQLAPDELQHLKNKGETYKTFSIELPG